MPLTRRRFLAGVAGVATTLGAVGSSAASSWRGVAESVTQPADESGLAPAVRFFESRRATVMLFGDSIVTGLGLADESDRWADRLQVRLRSDSFTALLTLDNRAVPGQSIISEMPAYDTFTRTERFSGGRLVDHVVANVPEWLPAADLPRIVVIVPSVNELIVSHRATSEDRVAYAISGLLLVRDYLRRRGIEHIHVVPMVAPTQAFDDSTARDLINDVALLNRELATAGWSTAVDYGLAAAGTAGSHPGYFERGYYEHNDGLHPGPLGHTAIAGAMFAMLRNVAIRL